MHLSHLNCVGLQWKKIRDGAEIKIIPSSYRKAIEECSVYKKTYSIARKNRINIENKNSIKKRRFTRNRQKFFNKITISWARKIKVNSVITIVLVEFYVIRIPN